MHHIVTADEGADGTQVGLHPGREDEGGFLAHPFSQFTLELFVQFEGSVEEAGTSAGGPVALDSVQCSLPDLGMGRQSKIVVRSAHDEAASTENGFGPSFSVRGMKYG